MGGRAWLAIAAMPRDDFFGGALATLSPPTLVVHGDDDPRTEPGELAHVRRELPQARFEVIAGGGHCPHAHSRTSATVASLIADFVATTG
jgi:pimeloyl-ACP methyl ester carboxylesterase